MAQTTNHSPGPQPNYYRIGQIHRELADELTKMSNTPQSDIGRTLDRMNEKLNEVNTAVQQLDGKIDRKIDSAVQQMNERIDRLSQQMRIRYIYFDEFL
jgi:outer membrane murein-binding lipoprotein Lpp